MPLRLHTQWLRACLLSQPCRGAAPWEGTQPLRARPSRQAPSQFRSRPMRASRSRPSGLQKLWQRDSLRRSQPLQQPIRMVPYMVRQQEVG